MSADRSTCVFDCANVVVANQSFRQHAAHSVRMRDASCSHMRHELLHSPSLPAATDATMWLLLMRPSPPSVGAILCRFARCGQSHAKWSPADAIYTARCAVSPWRTVHRCGMPRLQPRSRWNDECLAANRLCVFCKADPHSRALLRRTSSRPIRLYPPASSTLNLLAPLQADRRWTVRLRSFRRLCLAPIRPSACWTNASSVHPLLSHSTAPIRPMQDGSPFATELLPENAVRRLSCESAAPHRALLACDAWLRGKLCQRAVSPGIHPTMSALSPHRPLQRTSSGSVAPHSEST